MLVGVKLRLYLAADDVYRCPAGERLVYHYTHVEKGLICIDARHAKAALSLQVNKSDRWRCRGPGRANA